LRWFTQNASGMNVQLEDISESVAALALQGPTSGRLLRSLVKDADIENLKYFRVTNGEIAGVPVEISRTGYTGDLGYEIWVPSEQAIKIWDALMEAGRAFDIHPAGMLALDVARVEAGLLLIEIDFNSCKKALIDEQRYSPFEMGLGRLVHTGKNRFIGQSALIAEQQHGHAREIVGLEIDWPEVEQLYETAGLPPAVSPITSRVAVPVFKDGTQVGKATSSTWSPTLKKMIALATLKREYTKLATQLQFEITVEARRHRVRATVVKLPFFNPKRKTATPVV
jgi:aminomethyltransferase